MMNDFSGCSYFYNCSNIIDSHYVVNSQNVDSSDFVHDSIDIAYCEDVFKVEDATESHQVFNSQFINESIRISGSRNVVNSINVVNSDAVYDSKNIYECHNVLRCSELRKCVDATDSLFCADSTNIKRCLFCYGLTNAEYHIFNKPIDKDRYEMIVKQYFRYLSGELDYTKGPWPKSMLIPSLPKICLCYNKHYQLSDKFWKWARTIPGYDSMILYSITMNSESLDGQNQ